MMVHQVEAVVLRTWPIHEADQIVSLFTRDYGKIKGVAKAAARSRRRFGGALEPMTHVRAHYAERPSQELVRLDSFDILHSPLAEPVDYPRAAALAFSRKFWNKHCPTTIHTMWSFVFCSRCWSRPVSITSGCPLRILPFGPHG
jgi:DNA repair protein RecO (recombination protein O)